MEVAEYIFTKLLLIPSAFYTAIFAALLTLLSVYITNKGNNARFQKQLNHDKEKFDSEHRLSMKKDAFIEIAVAINQYLNIIPNMPNISIDQNEISSKIESFGMSISKAYVVGSNDTIDKLADFSKKITKTYLSLLIPRGELIQIATQIDMHNSLNQRSYDESDRLFTLIKHETCEENICNERIKRYQEALKFEQDQIQKRQVELNALYKKRTNKHGKFQIEVITHYSDLMKKIAPVIIAIRKECEFDAEGIDALQMILNKNADGMKIVFADFMETLEKN